MDGHKIEIFDKLERSIKVEAHLKKKVLMYYFHIIPISKTNAFFLPLNLIRNNLKVNYYSAGFRLDYNLDNSRTEERSKFALVPKCLLLQNEKLFRF